MDDDPSALLRREARSLVQRLRLWPAARWQAACPPYGTRADVAHHLAQALADLSAEAEGGPPRAVPRLDSGLALPDQLAVTAEDLIRAAPAPDVARRATAHLLLHRRDLLGEQVPPALLAALDLEDAPLARDVLCEETGRTTLGSH